MKLKYINLIKAKINIKNNKVSFNYLNGIYKSMYKDKSLDFNNLKEYEITDDIKDINWKSSIKTNKLLVKKYIKETNKKVLIIIDNNISMNADTNKGENKKELALYAAGTIGFIAINNNDYLSILFKEEEPIFKRNINHLEMQLENYNNTKTNSSSINKIIKKITKTNTKNYLIFIITDIKGINSLEINNIKILSKYNDIFTININDNYIYGNNIYNINNKKYIPSIFSKNKKLHELEINIRKELLNKNSSKLNKFNINIVDISSIEELNIKIIKLLKEHNK